MYVIMVAISLSQSISTFGSPSVDMFSKLTLSILGSGYRNRESGAFTNMGSNGNYWSAGVASEANSYYLNFNSGNVNPLNNNNRANGFAVRPVQAFNILWVFYNSSTVLELTRPVIHALLCDAYDDAKANERSKLTQLKFEIHQELNLDELANLLYKREYKVSPPIRFIIQYPTVREVFAPIFIDRVVSHLLFNMLNPLFDRLFIYDSYSCRVGKGTLFGIERFEHHIRSVTDNYRKEAFILSNDISGYFMNINRSILFDIIIDIFENYRYRPIEKGSNKVWNDIIDFDFVEYLLCELLFRDPLKGCVMLCTPEEEALLPASKSLLFSPKGTGLTIGDVLNQLFSNVYMNPYDQYVKRNLHCKNYGRYVDDSNLFSGSYEYLEICRDASEDFLKEQLKLQLHPLKTKIVSTKDTTYFLGAAIKNYRRYMTHRSIAKFHSVIYQWEQQIVSGKEIDQEKLLSQINSYLGHASHFNEFQMLDRALKDSPLNQILGFNKNYVKAFIKEEEINDTGYFW